MIKLEPQDPPVQHLAINPVDAEQKGIVTGDTVRLFSARGEIRMLAKVSAEVKPGILYTTFHFPESGANVITTDSSDWATNCPEYKVTAVQVTRVTQPSAWQRRYKEFDQRQQSLFRKAAQAEAQRWMDLARPVTPKASRRRSTRAAS